MSKVSVRDLKQKDAIGYVIQDLVVSKKRFFFLFCFLIFVVVLSYIPTFYFLFFHKEKVVLIDATGKPQLSYTVPDDRVFYHEAQHFFVTICRMIYERSYVDFLEKKYVDAFYFDLKKFFNSEKELSVFFSAYLNSPFVASILKGKYVTKVGTISSFDARKIKLGDKEVWEAYGLLQVSAFSEKTNVAVQEKGVVIRFRKGIRTWENPYGYYVLSFIETGSKSYSALTPVEMDLNSQNVQTSSK